MKAAVDRLNSEFLDTSWKIPSQTYNRTDQGPNLDIIEFPCHRHPRVSVELQVGAGLFVGGSSIEGYVRVTIEDIERLRRRRELAIARISIDLLGVEELSSSKRFVFLNLATELLDSDNPPPHNMVDSLKQLSPIDPFWALVPSTSTLSFILSLPLDVGPPPFSTKHARIRYVLAATMLIRDQGKQYLVRSSQDISVISVYDPEKALMSLPSPLTASDEYVRHSATGVETIKVTAGLHRQVWVSGTSIFVDVHVANSSKKFIKRLELQLERDILFYKHSAASTLEKSASQARIFDSNEKAILAKATLKQGHFGWNGVPAYSSDLRTCDMELPRGHATVRCGKFFEVRYFLNVVASTSHSKLVAVQLPLVLVHMNSLDVVPNSVAQVAAAIEEKRAAHSSSHPSARRISHDNVPRPLGTGSSAPSPPRLSRRPSSHASLQGRAFAAPRAPSLSRAASTTTIPTPHHHRPPPPPPPPRPAVDASPRRFQYSPARRNVRPATPPRPSGPAFRTPPSNRKARLLRDGDDGDAAVAALRARLRRVPSAAGAAGAAATPRSALRGSAERARRAEDPPEARRLWQGPFRKMRSAELWRGVAGAAAAAGGGGWLADRGREREGERGEKIKDFEGWI